MMRQSKRTKTTGRPRAAIALTGLILCAGLALSGQSPAGGGATSGLSSGSSGVAAISPMSPLTPDSGSNMNLSMTLVPPNYTLGPGDLVAITVYNMPELNRTAVVASKNLHLSYLEQSLPAEGLTTAQLRQEISNALRQQQILVFPQVDVSVLSVQSRPITVIGAVVKPSIIQEYRPITVLEAIIQAGGPAPNAGNTVVVTGPASDLDTVTPANNNAGSSPDPTPAPASSTSFSSQAAASPSGHKITGLVSLALPLTQVLAGTDPRYNITLHAGDYVRLLPGGQVYTAGAVKHPGAFPILAGQTLSIDNLVSLTGGWLPYGKPEKAFIVRHDAAGGTHIIHVNLPRIMNRKDPDVDLRSDDILYIPTSTWKETSLFGAKGLATSAFWALGYLIIK